LEIFRAIKREAISNSVAGQIIELIRNGSLMPGQKLPSERQLQVLLRVGRPAIREALSALQWMHILETRHGDGTYLTSLDPGEITRPFEVLIALSRPSLIELFGVRQVLEVGAAGLAALNVSDSQIAELRKCLDLTHRYAGDPWAFMENDIRLHTIIFDASSNSLLKNIAVSLQQMNRLSRELTTVFDEVRKQSVEDHSAIVKAISERNPDEAERAMRQHLLNVRAVVERISGSGLPPVM